MRVLLVGCELLQRPGHKKSPAGARLIRANKGNERGRRNRAPRAQIPWKLCQEKAPPKRG
jgi:hypothetical protein